MKQNWQAGMNSAADPQGLVTCSPSMTDSLLAGEGSPHRRSRDGTPEAELPDDLLSPARSSDSRSDSSVGGFTRRSPSSGGLSDLSSLSSNSFTDEGHSDPEDDAHSEFELVHAGQSNIESSWTDPLAESSYPGDQDDTPQASTLYHDRIMFTSSSLRFPDPQSSLNMCVTLDPDSPSSFSESSSPLAPRHVSPASTDPSQVHHAKPGPPEASDAVASRKKADATHESAVNRLPVSPATHPSAASSKTREFLRQRHAPQTPSRKSIQSRMTAPMPYDTDIEKYRRIDDDDDDNVYISFSRASIHHNAGSIADTIDAVRKACVATLALACVVCLAVYSTHLPPAQPTPCIRSTSAAVAHYQSPTPQFERLSPTISKCNQTLKRSRHESALLVVTQSATNALIRRPVDVLATIQTSTILRLTTSESSLTSTSMAPILIPPKPVDVSPARIARISEPSSTTAAGNPLGEWSTSEEQSVIAHFDLAVEHAYLALSVAYTVLVEELQEVYDLYIEPGLDLLGNTSDWLRTYRDDLWNWILSHHDLESKTSSEFPSENDESHSGSSTAAFNEAQKYTKRVIEGAYNVWKRPDAAAANVCRFALWGSLRPSVCEASLYRHTFRRLRRHVSLGHHDTRGENYDHDDGESSQDGGGMGQVAIEVVQGLGNVVKRPAAVMANTCRFFLRGMIRPDWCDVGRHLRHSSPQAGLQNMVNNGVDGHNSEAGERPSLDSITSMTRRLFQGHARLFLRHVAGQQPPHQPQFKSSGHDGRRRHQHQKRRRRSNDPTEFWQTFGLA